MPDHRVILVTKMHLGHVQDGDMDFGIEMLDKFFHALESPEGRPAAICFYTEGARAVCEGSPYLLGLQLLEGLGVRLLICQSCLERYGLRDSVAVGEVGGMNDIVALLARADSVVTI